MYLTGVDPTEVSDTLNEDGTTYRPDFELGSLYADDAGNIFQFVKCGEAFAVAGDVVVIDENNSAVLLDNTSSAPAAGQGMAVGVALGAVVLNTYAWVQRYGVVAAVNALTGAAAHTTLNGTATGGRVDDDGTAGSEDIPGLTITATAASNTAAGLLNWPYVGSTN